MNSLSTIPFSNSASPSVTALFKRTISVQRTSSSFKNQILSLSTLFLLILVLSALIAIAGSKSMDVVIQNSGRITLVGLDAYGEDLTSVNGAFSIDLGPIFVGASKNVSFYLKSISNVPIKLAFSVGDWTPESLEPYMHISLNCSGNKMEPNEEIPAEIEITTDTSNDFINFLLTNYVTTFSFGLSIQALEYYSP